VRHTGVQESFLQYFEFGRKKDDFCGVQEVPV
jgi:hypothetical protein